MQDRTLLMRGELRNDTRSNTTKPQSFHKNDDGHDNVSDSDTDSGGDDDDMSARKWVSPSKWSTEQLQKFLSEKFDERKTKKLTERDNISQMRLQPEGQPNGRLRYELRRRRIYQPDPSKTAEELRAELVAKVEGEIQRVDEEKRFLLSIVAKEGMDGESALAYSTRVELKRDLDLKGTMASRLWREIERLRKKDEEMNEVAA